MRQLVNRNAISVSDFLWRPEDCSADGSPLTIRSTLRSSHRSGVTLLRLLHLCELALPTTLGGLGARLGVEEVVPPPEAARVVTNEAFVMYVMVVSAGPEREEVVQAPWELITAMRVDGLEQTEDNPNIHGQDMEILGDGTPKNW